jgi:hypothetical protein
VFCSNLLTLPKIFEATFPRPREPITISSTLFASAKWQILQKNFNKKKNEKNLVSTLHAHAHWNDRLHITILTHDLVAYSCVHSAVLRLSRICTLLDNNLHRRKRALQDRCALRLLAHFNSLLIGLVRVEVAKHDYVLLKAKPRVRTLCQVLSNLFLSSLPEVTKGLPCRRATVQANQVLHVFFVLFLT